MQHDVQTSFTHCINSYCKALPRSRYQRDVILNSADEWITMAFNQSEDTSHPLSLRFLTSFSTTVVLSILWCLVFFLVFSICLFLCRRNTSKALTGQKSLPNEDDEATDADVSSNEVSEKMKKREKNKSYKERVNSVYYEWLTDHEPQRKPSNSDCTVKYK